MQAWLLLTALLAGAPQPAPPAPDARVEPLRAQALQLYRLRRYDEACALYARAAELAPADGAVLADLGLCLQKQGRTLDAVHVDDQAVQVGDARARANAYFNLGHLRDLTPPELARAPGPGCAALPSMGTCGAGLVVCRRDRPSLDFASRHALRSLDAYLAIGHERRETEQAFCISRAPVCLLRPPDALRAPEDGAEPRAAVTIRWANQLVDGGCPAGDEGCARERTVALAAEGRCRIVYANACTGRVGLVCEGAGGEAWPTVAEIQLAPVR